MNMINKPLDLLTEVKEYILDNKEARLVTLENQAVGYIFEDDDASYCLMDALCPSNTSASREEQSVDVFNTMNQLLQDAGMQFTDTVRTWFYNDKILDWYDEFNEVRTSFFKKHDVFKKMVPASTGIGIPNHAGAALMAGLLGIKPKTDKISIHTVPSPLQCSARDYDSSFSRAVSIELPGITTTYISGTASIEPEGATVHVDDIEGQVDLTMRVVFAILESQGMNWSNIERSIAYFKEIEYVDAFLKYCKDNSIQDMPVTLTHADVCRDDLLFEIEADAVKKV